MRIIPISGRQKVLLAALVLVASSLAPVCASASDVSGTVSFQGNVVFDAPIPGIALSDLTASSGPGIEATGNGEQCDILLDGSAPVGAGGAYPDSGALAVFLQIGRGGANPPDGTCRVQLRATSR